MDHETDGTTDEDEPMVQEGSPLLGNDSPAEEPKQKKQRMSPAKAWCFRKSNWTQDQLDQLVEHFDFFRMKYVIGRETCPTTGTPHLQGYVRHPEIKFRPMEKIKVQCHWEKAKGSMEHNLVYCTKEDTEAITNIEVEKPEELIYDEPYGWQIDALEVVTKTPDRRTIHWMWEPDGNIGKSTFVRYLVIKHGALVCAGKAADVKFMISQCKKAPKVIIFDVPRSNAGFISYTAIEEVKNGLFANSKYESSMHVQNWPHVLVFGNQPPDYEKMSDDRWNVKYIKSNKLVDYCRWSPPEEEPM
jgi:hypothetical protein